MPGNIFRYLNTFTNLKYLYKPLQYPAHSDLPIVTQKAHHQRMSQASFLTTRPAFFSSDLQDGHILTFTRCLTLHSTSLLDPLHSALTRPLYAASWPSSVSHCFSLSQSYQDIVSHSVYLLCWKWETSRAQAGNE